MRNRTDAVLYIEKAIAANCDRFREITVKYNNIPCTDAENEGKRAENNFTMEGKHFIVTLLLRLRVR